MDPQLIINLGMALAIVIIAGVGLRFLAPIIAQHFKGGAHGWRRLSEAYATQQPRPVEVLRQQSLVVGQVLYRRCMIVGFSDAGLYLEIGFPISVFGRRAALIPWSEIKEITEGRLYWRKAACLSLGEPPVGTITVPMELFDRFRPWLAPRLRAWPEPSGKAAAKAATLTR